MFGLLLVLLHVLHALLTHPVHQNRTPCMISLRNKYFFVDKEASLHIYWSFMGCHLEIPLRGMTILNNTYKYFMS